MIVNRRGIRVKTADTAWTENTTLNVSAPAVIMEIHVKVEQSLKNIKSL